MRVSDYYDWTAIEAVEMGALDFSLKKAVKSIGTRIRSAAKSVGQRIQKDIKKSIDITKKVTRTVRTVERRVWKKVAPTRVHEFTSRLGKKVRKHFPTYAPWLSIAAQALNFVIPGLGVAVGFAISAASAAIQLHAAKKAETEFKKLSDKAAREVQAEVDQANAEAEAAMMTAFDKGAPYFTQDYGVSRSQFAAFPMEEKVRFLNLVLYDQHADLMETIVPRDAFMRMPVEEQSSALSFMSQELEGAPGAFYPPYEGTVSVTDGSGFQIPVNVSTGPVVYDYEDGATKSFGPTIAPTTGGIPPWMIYAGIGGGTLVLGLALVIAARKR